MQKSARLLQQGLRFHQQGNLAEAEKIYRQVLAHDGRQADALAMLGALLNEVGRPEEARPLLEAAVEVRPESAIARANLGNSYKQLREDSRALSSYREALRIDPRMAGVHNNMGNLFRERREWAAAAEQFRLALEIAPQMQLARFHLAKVLTEMGSAEEALEIFEGGLLADSAVPTVHGEALFRLNYLSADPRKELAHHRRWAELYANGLAPRGQSPALPRGTTAAPERPIRVGYVSADFRRHSVRFFLLPLLRHHDRSRFEIHCYADLHRGRDGDTACFASLAARFSDVTGLTDAELAARVRGDEIDVLVDLGGHTQHNRLLTFARRPAPLQVSYLGYPNTTGMASIDLRLTDAVADPPAAPDAGAYAEKLVRLSGCFLCYEPPEFAPPVSPLPALSNGYITFGCFANAAKITREMMGAWAQLMKKVPASRLMFKFPITCADGQWEAIRSIFSAGGIADTRLGLLPPVKEMEEHLGAYAGVDIAFDTAPYNGTTTTCEALWMGVPVVTLAGEVHRSRVGAALLTAAGRCEWIATGLAAYERAVVDLAGDVDRLASLRGGLQDSLRVSPLLDGNRLAREIEQVYTAHSANFISL